MPKFARAFYLAPDPIGWISIEAAELTHNKIAECRSLDLRDAPDGCTILGVRNHPKTPHFFSKGFGRISLGNTGGGEGPKHKDRCAEITRTLSSATEAEVGYFYFVAGNKYFEHLHTLSGYRWKKPGNLDVVKQSRYIPDILGRSPEIDLLDKSPLVAIEVVDTHFSDLPTFEVLLQATGNLPLFVAYMFCSEYPRLCQVKLDNVVPTLAKIRTSYFIWDGSFWLDGIRFEDQPDYEFTGKIADYYNKIKDTLIALKFIRV